MVGRAAVLPGERNTQRGRLEPQHLTMTKVWKRTQAFLPRLSCCQTAVLTWEAVRQAAAQGQKARHSLPPSGVGCRVLMAGGDTNPGLLGRFQKHI